MFYSFSGEMVFFMFIILLAYNVLNTSFILFWFLYYLFLAVVSSSHNPLNISIFTLWFRAGQLNAVNQIPVTEMSY